MSKGKWSRTRR